jgi:hypothetical protein
MPDTKTIDMKAEGRMFDPWALWRETLDRISRECEKEQRGMTENEIQTLNQLYFNAQRMEFIPHA